MSISLIVLGATGRMGSTLVRMIQENPQLELSGVVEKSEKLGFLQNIGCPASAHIEDLLAKTPKSTIIDFTSPEISLSTAKKAVKTKSKHVIGTTGFSKEQKKELEELALQTPIFWSPNMSVGVNVLLSILPQLTKMLGDDYDVEMAEIHHNKKKDSPSGTALRLAECIANAKDWNLSETACYHREGIIGERPEKEIGIQALRGGDVVGIHTTYFLGQGERIEVTHQAHSRDNFAKGALRAARWLEDKPAKKLYSMQDIF